MHGVALWLALLFSSCPVNVRLTNRLISQNGDVSTVSVNWEKKFFAILPTLILALNTKLQILKANYEL